MRIIDADALRAELEHYDKDEHLMWCELDMYKVVDAQPTIERPHGEWIVQRLQNGFDDVYCPYCKARPRRSDYGYYLKDNFCYKCGADLRVKNELGGRE